MNDENEDLTVISTNPDAAGGNNLLKIKAECKLWVRVPIKMEVGDIEIHPVTLLEMIKGSNDDRLEGALSDPMSRIEDALEDDMNELVLYRRIDQVIDYERLDKATQDGDYFADYIYGKPDITDLTIEITS